MIFNSLLTCSPASITEIFIIIHYEQDTHYKTIKRKKKRIQIKSNGKKQTDNVLQYSHIHSKITPQIHYFYSNLCRRKWSDTYEDEEVFAFKKIDDDIMSLKMFNNK